MTESPTKTQIIVRYSPFSPDRIQINAEGTVARDTEEGRPEPRYGVSAFGCWTEDGESVDEAVLRVCETARKNGKKIAVVTDGDLAGIGLQAIVDEPPPKHQLLGSGNLGSPPDYDALSQLFNENRRNNPL